MLQQFKNLYHLFQSILANVYYGFPGRNLKVIGITGTDGKTTTAHLIYHILKSAGKKVSLISSVYANIAGKTYDTGFHVTTPDVFPLQRFLSQSVKAGDEYFVLETTSHALSQNRAALINYQVGVITNVTHEHLDFHRKYENYAASKSILLQKAKIAFLNRDDRSFSILKKLIKKKYFTYGIKNNADYHIDLNSKYNLGITKFNNYNYLAAYSVCTLLNISEKSILTALKTFKLPTGRLEIIQIKPFTVIIDFAHTPNAIHQVLSDTRERLIKPNKRLIHVFGQAAKRDSSKRKFMGEESARYADFIILTEEDYRDEDPNKICNEIAAGIKNKEYEVIIDRKKAIEKAIQIAKPGDVVILTGKSHEKSLCRGNTEYPWSEKSAALSAINKFKLRKI